MERKEVMAGQNKTMEAEALRRDLIHGSKAVLSKASVEERVGEKSGKG